MSDEETDQDDLLDGDTDETDGDDSPDSSDDSPANVNSDPDKPVAKTKRGRPLTYELYQRLIEGFRDFGSINAAAKHAGVHRQTAAKAYNESLKTSWGQIPIKTLLEQEKLAARATLTASANAAARVAAAAASVGHSQATIEHLVSVAAAEPLATVPTSPHDIAAHAKQAQADAIRARVEKARSVRLARSTLTLVIAQTAVISRAQDKLMTRLTAAIDRLLPEIDVINGPDYKPNLKNMRFVLDLLTQSRDLQASNVRLLAEIHKVEDTILGPDEPLAAAAEESEETLHLEATRLYDFVEQQKRHKAKKASNG